jgi:hypothetical protein
MLARYKKPGGFLQLLSLIESFGPQKREKFMEMIHAEDAVWAEALQTKILTLDRLFKWPEQTLTEIFRVLPTKNLACVIKGISQENADKFLKYLSHAEKRKLEDELGTLDAKPDDIFASVVRVIEVTRKMIKEGDIRLDKVDPEMMVPENFEEKLGAGGAHAQPHASSAAHRHAAVVETEFVADAQQTALKKKAEAGELDAKAAQEILHLHRTLTAINKENLVLKEELKALREKLEQIRRIA